jgi:methyl-accepting chemotaxis protein
MLNNIKLGVKLSLGFGLSVVVTLIVGWVASSYLQELSALTGKLYRHPFTVSVSVLEIQGAVTRMHRSMKDVALAKDAEQLDKAAAAVAQDEAGTLKFFDTLQERFLGDKSDIIKARQLFVEWKPIREEVITFMRVGKQAEAAQITKTRGAAQIQGVYESLEKIKTFSLAKAAEFVANADRKRENALNFTYLTIAVGIILAILTAFLLTRSITQRLAKVVEVTKKVAEGHLVVEMETGAQDELGQLQQAMHAMTQQLKTMVGQINQTAVQVDSAATEIAQGNVDLSQRTEQQASALEETASSMEELTSTVRQSADNASHANQLASAARGQAEQGGYEVDQAIIAMHAINQSSHKIADIIGVINQIAFQTNLLALNAAVEAARAGEQGRGFAVVAGEVRKLAQRSAEAAREIKELITDSVNKVEDGSQLVEHSGQTLKAIVNEVKKVSDIVAEIATAAREQANGIEQVNKAILQIDEVTQQNAALVEQTAAASHAMGDQTHELQKLMGFFKLKNEGLPPAARE